MVSHEFIEEVLDYCKLEEADDTEEVKTFIESAVQKVEVETGKVFSEKQPLCKQAVKMIVLDWYDHRGGITTENIRDLPPPIGTQYMLNQISMSSEFKRKE